MYCVAGSSIEEDMLLLSLIGVNITATVHLLGSSSNDDDDDAVVVSVFVPLEREREE